MGSLKVSGNVLVTNGRDVLACGANLVVDSGEALLAELIMATTAAKIGFMGMGPDGTAPSASQTTLIGTQIERVAVTATRAGNVMTYTGVFGAGIVGTATAREFGLFNASGASGTMLARFTVQPIEVQSSDVIQAVWSLTIGD